MAFETILNVRFGDCDPAGFVYYPVLYHYCHVAFEEAWSGALGMPYHELVRSRRLGFPTVHVETDFLSPLVYGDALRLRVHVARVGASSVVLVFDGRCAERRVLRSTHTKVCTNLDTLKPEAIPGPLRSALEALTP